MVRYDNGTQKATLHLIRETKGGNDLAMLRFPYEKRKIISALKYFAKLGVDYDFTTGENPGLVGVKIGARAAGTTTRRNRLNGNHSHQEDRCSES